MKAIADTHGSLNVVYIKIHTSNDSLTMAQEDVHLCELDQPDAMPRRSNRSRTHKTCFKSISYLSRSSLSGEVLHMYHICVFMVLNFVITCI
jgi:hypothetical protein